MTKRILVTGGAGFIGSHLVERLVAEGANVTVMDNFFTGSRKNVPAGVEIITHDVMQPFSFECDELYHLACPASPVHYQRNPVRTIRTCVMGTVHALDAARECGAKILIASTSEVYGDPAVHPQVESYSGNVNPIGPRASYDEGKRCAESLAVSYKQQYNLDVRIPRIFNTYGPRMSEDDGRVVSNFIDAAINNRPLILYGSGNQTRSFCYVSDLVDGFLDLMASDISGVPVNLGNPGEITVRALAEKVIELIRKQGWKTESKIVEGPAQIDDPCRRCPDIGRAKEKFGFSPKVSLDEGLSNILKWMARKRMMDIMTGLIA